MNKTLLVFALIMATSFAFSQKKDKIKGSKIVTIEQKKTENFSALEVADNIEVMLIRGEECGIEIEADDNLHEAIDIAMSGSTLRLSTLKDIISAKKISVRVTYTDEFKLVVAKNEAQVSALATVELNDFSCRTYDYAKLFLYANSKNFSLECNDKSKVELNLKSEKTTINLSKNSTLKALVNSTEMIFDMYQKSDATIDGTVTDLKLRLDNNSNFMGKTCIAQNALITTEGYTNASVNVATACVIDASGNSDIRLYGEPKIEMKRFADSALLMKKILK